LARNEQDDIEPINLYSLKWSSSGIAHSRNWV